MFEKFYQYHNCMVIGSNGTSTWPHLRCDVGLEEEKFLLNCFCIVYEYNSEKWYKQFEWIEL